MYSQSTFCSFLGNTIQLYSGGKAHPHRADINDQKCREDDAFSGRRLLRGNSQTHIPGTSGISSGAAARTTEKGAEVWRQKEREPSQRVRPHFGHS